MQTSADIAVYLVTQGCFAMVAQTPPLGRAPDGVVLSAAERAAEGFRSPGVTMRYPAPAGGAVVADFGPETSVLRFQDGDAYAALAALERAISSNGRDMQATHEHACGDGSGRVQRIYFARVSDRRYARVTALYAKAPHADLGSIEIRVTGLEAVGHHSGG